MARIVSLVVIAVLLAMPLATGLTACGGANIVIGATPTPTRTGTPTRTPTPTQTPS